SLFLLSGLLAFSQSALSMDLDSAKQAGLVGELANGYLGAVSTPASQEVQKLVNDINAKRKLKYEEIAKSQQVPLRVVESQSGSKLIQRTKTGHYVNRGASWEKK